jgi:hypothetical protein
MRLLLRIREGESDDDSDGIPAPEPYEPEPPTTLRLRCYACAGRRTLWVTDELWPRGRHARCIACRGTGRVTIPG